MNSYPGEVFYPENKKPKRITDRQIKFCEEYLSGKSARQAALSAGYSDSTASKKSDSLFKMPCIAEYIKKTREKRDKKVSITYQDKIEICMRLIKKCEDDGDPRGAAALITILNKMQGHNAAETTVQISAGEDTDLRKLSDTVNRFKKEF